MAAISQLPEDSPHRFHTPQASYSYEDLRKSGRGELFGPGNAQLPSPPMLMLDRITSIDIDGGAYKKGRIVAELDVKPDLWFFQCHFPGDPVMPGCLGLDAMWQLVGFWLGWSGSPGRGRALGTGDVSFTGQVTPESRLVTYEIDIRKAIRSRLVMGIADGIVKLDGEPIYEAKSLKVGLIKAAA